MESSVQKAILPMTVCCVLLGFYTADIRNRNIRRIATTHCWLLAIAFCATWAVLMLIKLMSGMQQSFFIVTYELTGIMYITTLTYYRIKYIVDENITSNVFRNIDFADKCLKRFGVSMWHLRERLECAMFALGIVALCALRTYHVISKGQNHHLLGIVRSKFNLVESVLMSLSKRVIMSHLFITFYFVVKRLVLLRNVLRTHVKSLDRKIAWVSSARFLSFHTPTVMNSSTLMAEYFKEIRKINACIDDAFCNVRIISLHYLCFHVILYILWTSLTLFSSVVEKDVLYFVYFTFVNFVLNMVPVALCLRIRNLFVDIQETLNKLYWLIQSKRPELSTKNLRHWLLQCGHMDRKFDCGYFVVDWKIFSLSFDYVILLVFAMPF